MYIQILNRYYDIYKAIAILLKFKLLYVLLLYYLLLSVNAIVINYCREVKARDNADNN